jgi:hypothetical protein
VQKRIASAVEAGDLDQRRAPLLSNSGNAYPTTPGHFEQFACAP